MKLLLRIGFFFCLLQLSFGLKAQEKQPTQSIDQGSIDEQFEYVTRTSSNWNDKKGQSYEVIKRNLVFTLKDHVLDSLNTLHNDLREANRTVESHASKIQSLTDQLNENNNNLEVVEKEKDSISLMGLPMAKSTFKWMVGIIMATLLTLLIVTFLNSRRVQQVTRSTKETLSKRDLEFAEYKRVSLEREQKIKRQLQDEINRRNK